MKHSTLFWTCSVALLGSLVLNTTSVSVAQQAHAQGVAESKTLLDTIDLSAWNPRSLAVSPDIRSIAYIQRTSDRKVQVVRDGKTGALFDAIKRDSLIFSPDGERLAYQATKGKQQFIIVDESVSTGYDKVLNGSFAFSPNGKRYAYAAQKKNKWLAVVDGELSPPYRRIVPYSLQFSPDGKRVAYVARTTGSKHVMVIDGKVGSLYDNIWIGPSLFDSTSARTAYVTQTAEAWSVVMDGQEGSHFNLIEPNTLIFSKDGQHTAYAAQAEHEWVVVHDGVVGAPYDRIRTQSLSFSRNGDHLAYAAKQGETWGIIADGNAIGGQTYDDIDGIQPRYNHDGSKLAFGVRLGNQWGVVVDDTLGIPHTDIGHDTFRFSQDNEHFAYTAELEGSWFMMIDGEPDTYAYGKSAIEARAFTRIGVMGPLFSPDGKRFAYSVVQGLDKLGVVVDEQLGRPHWSLIEESLRFSPDSRKISYVTGSADGKWRVMVERKVVGHSYDGVAASGVTFTSDSAHVLFAAERNRKWMAVVDGQEGEAFDHLLAGKNGLLHLNDSNELRYIGRQGNKIYVVETKVGAV